MKSFGSTETRMRKPMPNDGNDDGDGGGGIDDKLTSTNILTLWESRKVFRVATQTRRKNSAKDFPILLLPAMCVDGLCTVCGATHVWVFGCCYCCWLHSETFTIHVHKGLYTTLMVECLPFYFSSCFVPFFPIQTFYSWLLWLLLLLLAGVRSVANMFSRMFFYFCARVWMWPNRKHFVRVRFLDLANIDALSLTCSVSHPAVGSLSSAHTEYQMALCMCDGALVRSTAGLPMYLRVHKNFFYRFGHRIGWLSEWVCIHLVVFTKKSTLMSAYGKTFIAGPELCKNLLTGGARRATRKS